MCGGVKDIRPSDPDPERIGKPRRRASTVPPNRGTEKPRPKGNKMKPETKDTIIFYAIMVVVVITTILGVIAWGISRAWRFLFKEKTI